MPKLQTRKEKTLAQGRCFHCRYWGSEMNEKATSAECHGRAPVALPFIIMPDDDSERWQDDALPLHPQWPNTLFNDFCGDFKEAGFDWRTYEE